MAGGVLTAKQAPHRPGTAPALGLRAGNDVSSFYCRPRGDSLMLSTWFATSTNGKRRSSRRRFVPRLELLEGRALPSTFTVLNLADSGDGSLRQAVLAANANPGPDAIDFADGLTGTIGLTTGQLAITDGLTIDGPGADQLAVSGNHQSRIFSISGGVTVTIAGLTLTDGKVLGANGGAIVNAGSSLTLARDVLSNNEALRDGGGPAQGGAVANVSGATLTICHSLLSQNQAIGISGGSAASGGAILNSSSHLTVTDSTFMGNQAHGGDGGGNAAGGAILNTQSATATVTDSTFTGNETVGGDGGVVSAIIQVGTCRGGSIANDATFTIENSTFAGNRAIGGNGGSGGSGASVFYAIDTANGAGVQNNGTLFLSGSTFTDNQSFGGSNATGGTNGQGLIGFAGGGALHNAGRATITNTMFDHNEAHGGNGNTATGFLIIGMAAGAGIANSGVPTQAAVMIADHVTLHDNLAVGGTGNTPGPFGGIAFGAGLINILGTTVTLSNSTIVGNQAFGGLGGAGDNGRDALGGGLANMLGGTLTVSDCTLADNQAVGGAGEAGGNGLGGGIFNDGPSIKPLNQIGR